MPASQGAVQPGYQPPQYTSQQEKLYNLRTIFEGAYFMGSNLFLEISIESMRGCCSAILCCRYARQCRPDAVNFTEKSKIYYYLEKPQKNKVLF